MRLSGSIGAALTPLAPGGSSVDDKAISPYVDYLRGGGLDGLLCLGSAGEGILLSARERRRAAELFVEAAAGRMAVAVHAGAQSTSDTVALAEHAATIGADAVAVIAPPYFRLDAAALAVHLTAAAHACAPTPFYVYEFATISGYAIPPEVIEQLRQTVPNLRGMKVSDAPFSAVRPYMIEGLDLFVGAEALISEALIAGAAGAVSGLASTFPELVVAAVRDRTAAASARAADVRAILDAYPRHAAMKTVVRARGVPLQDEVWAPLRRLTDSEQTELFGHLDNAGVVWRTGPAAVRASHL